MEFTFRKAVTLNIFCPHKNCEYSAHITSIQNFLANIFHHTSKHFLRAWDLKNLSYFQHVFFSILFFYQIPFIGSSRILTIPHLVFDMTGMLHTQNCMRVDDVMLNDLPAVIFFSVCTFHVF